MVDMIPFPALF